MDGATEKLSDRLAAAWAPEDPMSEQAKDQILRDLREMESELAVARSIRHVSSEASQDA